MVKRKTNDRNRGRIVDEKWESIFNDYNALDIIEESGAFYITSSQINKYKEARLMTKFDYESSLPDVFYDHDLSILPTKRGEYIVGHFDAYEKLKTTDAKLLENRKEISFPSWIETIDTTDITSESTMLNAANASGMIADLFNENIEEVVQTVSGRMSSKQFSFNIDSKDSARNYNIRVENAQVEIDGGFETPDKLILFEAKNNTTNSFLVRQLYYPYQLWAKQVNKKVVPVFLQYANDTFNFSVYEFDDVNDYNSLKLIERKNYIFGAEHTTLNDLAEIQKNVKIIQEDPDIPFPQANTMSRLLGIIEAIRESSNGYVSMEALTIVNDFVLRQAHYYASAAAYIGLIERIDGTLTLTKIGKEYSNANRKSRNLIIARQILEHKAFNLVLKRSLERTNPLNQREAYHFLESENFYEPGLSASTRERRAGTIASWVRYLFSVVDDY